MRMNVALWPTRRLYDAIRSVRWRLACSANCGQAICEIIPLAVTVTFYFVCREGAHTDRPRSWTSPRRSARNRTKVSLQRYHAQSGSTQEPPLVAPFQLAGARIAAGAKHDVKRKLAVAVELQPATIQSFVRVAVVVCVCV